LDLSWEIGLWGLGFVGLWVVLGVSAKWRFSAFKSVATAQGGGAPVPLSTIPNPNPDPKPEPSEALSS